MSEVLDFLDSSEAPAQVETTPVAPAIVTPEEGSALNSEPVKETSAPKEEVIQEVPAATPVPAEAPKEDKTVPLATFLDVLNENKELKKNSKAPEKTPETEEFQAPDPVKQPAEYAAYQETMFQFNLMNERMNNSERFARKEHGNELIDKVRDYATERMDKDPNFAKLITTSADPYEDAIKAYKEGEELKEYRAWVANGKKPLPITPAASPQPAAAAQPVVVKPQPAAEPLPTSIADGPSSGGPNVIISAPGTAFDSVFGN